eukprot:scaffold53436_cov60-Phaeocystis_antarctica.AAC.5
MVRRWNRGLWRRLARAPEAVAGRPEPPGVPRGGAGAELGQCQDGSLSVRLDRLGSRAQDGHEQWDGHRARPPVPAAAMEVDHLSVEEAPPQLEH